MTIVFEKTEVECPVCHKMNIKKAIRKEDNSDTTLRFCLACTKAFYAKEIPGIEDGKLYAGEYLVDSDDENNRFLIKKHFAEE